MPGIELTKKEKKAAREIVEMGLQKEFAKALSDVDAILNDWKSKGSDNRDAYYRLFKKITNFDKHIARRYDGMSGSNYLLIIIAQLQDGIISTEDLGNLPEGVQLVLKQFIE